ncbi:hypothetical protein [Peredibacter starrii]|uniref:Uncharacterized protein n=1 Tax=Peredibacter starrii TaxID=28202 RepID=A0AAX4HS11_9BACT|nr:hypothetical protein [Peredibacter starrii]WPU65997.1 hypothetical protein SOO65_04495 [Peredibacter starrii]
MRMTFLLSLVFLFSMVGQAFAVSDLDSRIAQFKKLQSRVEKECLKNANSKNFEIEVEGKKLKCQELIVITNQLKIQIDKEVAELKACEEAPKGAALLLAADTGKILEQSGSCKPSPDQGQCLKQFGCATLAAVGPMKSFMEIAGKAFDSTALKECSGQGNDCLLNVLRGIFDSIWSSLNLVWDLGKMAVTKTGELLGIVEKSEIETSERAMAAQQASPGFLKSMASDPVGTVKTMAKNLYDSLEEAAMNHYGCEKWAGLPFTSKCLAPMTTWNCASCAQKSQVYCGIAGYAVGEIGTALLTGGLVAGGKAVIVGSVKLASGPAKNVAAFMSKSFPKATSVTAKAGQKIGSVAKTTLTFAERKSVDTWERIANSKTVEAISKSAKAVSESVVGKVVGAGLKPISVYLSAMDKAFRLGYTSVDNAVARATGAAAVPAKVAAGAKIADEAMGVKEPTVKVAKDQSKATPGFVIVDSPKVAPPPFAKTAIAEAVEQVKAPSVASKPTQVPLKAPAAVSKSAEVADDLDVAAQVAKYKDDQEYFKLFTAKKPYDDYHNDVAAVIMTLEKTHPNMSKAEIRKSIESMMNSCDL